MPVNHSAQIQSRNGGFTLIEVLVAALVLAIGILGLATTMLLGLKSDQSAYFRSQASAIAYDMADRIRLNRTAADAGTYNNVDTNGTIPGDPSCTSSSGGCSSAQQAVMDAREWMGNFVKVDNAITNFSPKLPNGRGVVSRDGSGRYVITVTWSEADTRNRANTTQSLSVRMTL